MGNVEYPPACLDWLGALEGIDAISLSFITVLTVLIVSNWPVTNGTLKISHFRKNDIFFKMKHYNVMLICWIIYTILRIIAKGRGKVLGEKGINDMIEENIVFQNVKTVQGETMHIQVTGGVITAISKEEIACENAKIVDFGGTTYVSPGWIDMHVHAFSDFDPYGDEIDEIGYKSGVTTIVDAGSCGADRFHELVARGEAAKTNLLAFLNISRTGLERVDELSDLRLLDGQKIAEIVSHYSHYIVGLKARISRSVVKDAGIEPLKIARIFSEVCQLPLMVHIGSSPPDIRDVLVLLKKNDILTHYLHGKANGLFDENGSPLPEFLDACERGIHLDVGHGTASFSFQIAKQAILHGLRFDTISTDIYRRNRVNGPVYSMANVLSKFLYVGYSLPEVIDAVTLRAANWLRRPELGMMSVGQLANLTFFSVENQPVRLIDSVGEEVEAQKEVCVKGVVINGEYFRH